MGISCKKQEITFYGIIVYDFNMNIYRTILKSECESGEDNESRPIKDTAGNG
jgi:hypothetical protein